MLVMVLALLALAACSNSTEPGSSATSPPQSSSTPSSDVSRPVGSQSDAPPQSSTPQVNDNPGADNPAPPPNDNPQGAQPNDENNIKQLMEPMFDPFPIQYPFLTADVNNLDVSEPISITKIDMIYGTAQESVILASEEQINALWALMGETEITAEGALETNPSTGGALTLKFQFSDKSAATVSMANIVWLNDNGPFLFADEASEQRYVDFFFSQA